MAQRSYRRERKYTATLNVPMTLDMRNALEAIADEALVSVVEAARRCIGSALERPGVHTLSDSDQAKRERVLNDIAKALHGQAAFWQPDRNVEAEELADAISEATRLGLDDVVTLLTAQHRDGGDSHEYDYLAFALLDSNPEARTAEAKERLMAHFRAATEQQGDMASGSDGSGGLLSRRARRRRKADLEAERDALQEKIDALRDEIYSFEEGISETSHDETVDTAIAKRQAALDKLETKRGALQEKIDAL